MLEFDASIFGGELPVGLGVVGIAIVLPGGDFVDEGLFVGDAAIEALGREDAEFRLGARQQFADRHKTVARLPTVAGVASE